MMRWIFPCFLRLGFHSLDAVKVDKFLVSLAALLKHLLDCFFKSLLCWILLHHRVSALTKALQSRSFQDVVETYAQNLAGSSSCSPDLLHFAIEKSWALLPHLSKLASLGNKRG